MLPRFHIRSVPALIKAARRMQAAQTAAAGRMVKWYFIYHTPCARFFTSRTDRTALRSSAAAPARKAYMTPSHTTSLRSCFLVMPMLRRDANSRCLARTPVNMTFTRFRMPIIPKISATMMPPML